MSKARTLAILLLLLSVPLMAQTVQGPGKVTGQVLDVSGLAVPGVTVIESGTQNAAVTDLDGYFQITVPSDATIEFQSLGYEQQRQKVEGRSVINVTLNEEAVMLEDAVIIGYGSEKKRNVSGAISNIGSEQISKISAENFQKALQGRSAGVRITSSSGVPGGAVDIVIRGRGTLNSGTEPLYIIDGIQMNTSSLSNVVGSDQTNPLANLNPEDIESIDILKDGATASIYGAQAANGVILVTTKKGSQGKATVSAKASVGWQQLVKTFPTLTGPEWAEISLIAAKNLNQTQYNTMLAQFQAYGYGEDGYSNAPTTDWQDAVYQNGLVQDYQVSVSGGTDKTTYYVSGSLNATDGSMMNSFFNRGGIRTNLSTQITNWLEFKTSSYFNVTGQRVTNQGGTYSNPARASRGIIPTIPIYQEDGSYNVDNFFGEYLHNIVQVSDLIRFTNSGTSFSSNNELIFKIAPGLTLNSSFGIDYQNMKEKQFVDPRTRWGKVTYVDGGVAVYNSGSTNMQTEHVLNYNAVFNEVHRIAVTAGGSYRHMQRTLNYTKGETIPNYNMDLLSAVSQIYDWGETFSEWKMLGFFGRVNYTLKDNYILNAIKRYDGSSRFGENHKFGVFPSVSAAWRISGERFMENLTFIDDLKLKAGYGVTGNANIGNYSSLRLFAAGTEYDGIKGIYPSAAGNPRLTWEENYSTDIGLTLSMFKGRFFMETDYFNRTTKNLLYDMPVPSMSGFTSVPSNVGSIANYGVELLLTGELIKKQHFQWTSTFNFTFAHNEVLSLSGGVDQLGTTYKVGEPVIAYYTYQWAGVNPSDGRPMYYDKDNYITYRPKDSDRVWLKEGGDPRFFGGWLNEFSYKGFDLSVFFQFQEGARAFWPDKRQLMGNNNADRNLWRVMYEDYWQNPGDRTWVPKPIYGEKHAGEPYTLRETDSSLLYEKTDYIKLKNVSLAYNFPRKMLSSLRISALQLYVHGSNLWTTTTYPGYDPEFTGSDQGIYPQTRSYVFGLKLDF